MKKQKLKKWIKDYGVFLLVFLFGLLITWVPIPYYIEGPGGLISLDERFSIEGETIDNYHLAYVSNYPGSILGVLLSFLSKDYDVYPETRETENHEEENFRSHMMLEEANQDALIFAYLKAEKEVKIEKEEVYVAYLFEEAETDLKVGDQLLTVDGEDILSKVDLKEKLSKKKAGDKLTFTVLYDGKKKTRYAYLNEIDGTTIIGILPTVKRKIAVNPEIAFTFKKSESGSSGGFMMSLAIYDLLVEEDISKGLKIAGTGTIDLAGNVGEIGGIEYKIMGALKEGTDIFFLPYENYEEAKKTVERKKGTMTLVPIHTFDEALLYLEKR